MRITNGISCKVNTYHVTATASVSGEVKRYTFDTDKRDAKAAKKSVADELGIPASKIIVDFKLEKKNFVINTDYDNLVKVLTDNGITVSVDSEE
jgi:hypothetical protein